MDVGAEISIGTWERLDEILAGAWLALIHARWPPASVRAIPRAATLLVMPLLLASGHEAAGPLNYLRPYHAVAAVGLSLYAAPAAMRRLFASRAMGYVAQVSFAVYVFHGMLSATWLGSGDTMVKYGKRPLLLLATFAAAHLPTFRFEMPMIAIGKRVGARLRFAKVR